MLLFIVFFKIPFGVTHIMGGETLRLVWACLLDEFRWHAAPNLVGTDLRALQDEGSGSHDGAFTHHDVVEDGGPHADECAALDGAGVDGGVVTDGDIVFDDGGTYLVGDVHAGTVLHVHAVAHMDVGHIATDYGIEPDGTFIAHLHFAHDGGVLTEITVFAPFRGQTFY